MIRVTIEFIEHGVGTPEKIGEIIIANDGTGDNDSGNYITKLMKTPNYGKGKGVWKRGRVRGFPRRVLGAYDLLYLVLKNAVEGRNGTSRPEKQPSRSP